MAPFKFDSRSFFLTYAQSGELTRQQVQDHLGSIAVLEWCRVASEQHEDGNPHIHAVGRWDTRVQSRNPRFLDVAGFHPNIQPIRSVRAAVQYVSKDGQFTDIGAVPEPADPDTDWAVAATQLTEAEYFRRAMRARVSYMYADRFWRMARAHAATEIGEDYVPDVERECFELRIHVPADEKSTVVIGPTGCGKTSWAKRVAKKPALWVRHIDTLRCFRAGHHQSIIFDDMSFKHMPREAQIHITDWSDEAQLHCRYGVALIPAQVQKIFTANEMPFSDDSAVARRIYKIVVIGFQV